MYTCTYSNFHEFGTLHTTILRIIIPYSILNNVYITYKRTTIYCNSLLNLSIFIQIDLLNYKLLKYNILEEKCNLYRGCKTRQGHHSTTDLNNENMIYWLIIKLSSSPRQLRQSCSYVIRFLYFLVIFKYHYGLWTSYFY